MKRRRTNSNPVTEQHHDEDAASLPDFSTKWMLVASFLIVLQLFTVTAEPLRFFTRSSRGNSPATDPARDALAPLVEFGYMNHGYFFFAPEPGPSHLLDFRFENDQGPVQIRFPDRKAQWPRLLYHRHFMLTENLNQLWVPPVDPTLSASDPFADSWRIDRARYETIRDSMRTHVGATYGAVGEVQVDRVMHELPLLEDVVDGGMDLQDPRLYITLPDVPLGDLSAVPQEQNAGSPVPPAPVVTQPVVQGEDVAPTGGTP